MNLADQDVNTKQSFFDTGQGLETFWSQTSLSDFTNYPTLVEEEFYIHSKKVFFGWQSYTVSIRGNFLVCSKVNPLYTNLKYSFRRKRMIKIVDYIDLDVKLYQLKLTPPAEKPISKKYKHSFSIRSYRKSVAVLL